MMRPVKQASNTRRRNAEKVARTPRQTIARRQFLYALGAGALGLPFMTGAVLPAHNAAQHRGLTTLDTGLASTDSPIDTITARRVRTDVPVTKLDHAAWAKTAAVRLERYWSGAKAPEGRHAEARVIWSAEALSVRFACRQSEPLVVSPTPQTDTKTIGLWDRDVCEIFIAPDARTPEKYFEFEAAPTGEWLDVGIHVRPDKRESDWQYASGMTTAARVAQESVVIAMRIPWRALTAGGRPPRAGERWRANLFRCVGADPARGYLAWQPTRTPEPAFHVPAAFGWLEFK